MSLQILRMKMKFMKIDEQGKAILSDELSDAHLFKSGSEARAELAKLPKYMQHFLEPVPLEDAMNLRQWQAEKLAKEYQDGEQP